MIEQARASNSCGGFADAELDELESIARALVAADTLFMKLVNRAGKVTGSVLSRLPEGWQGMVQKASAAALKAAWAAAGTTQPQRHRGRVGRALSNTTGEGFHRVATAVSGAVGGAGGAMTTVLVDLPATTTLILRSIQQIAADYGEDLDAPDVRANCIAVFAMGGPMSADDDREMSLYAARTALTGKAIGDIILSVAPRFGVVVSQKAVAQAAPVLGAVAGAAINPIFTRYYQKMAHVRFRLRRLERAHDPAQVQACFERMVRSIRKPDPAPDGAD
ncbi:EcsC family protein [Sphingomonas sp. HF-S3]|uniref:EcsC family protein n=1 Tax=Sphingomonas rustica TaxID=3103142 RepID=A0ABV0B5Z2_9SPHN